MTFTTKVDCKLFFWNRNEMLLYIFIRRDKKRLVNDFKLVFIILTIIRIDYLDYFWSSVANETRINFYYIINFFDSIIPITRRAWFINDFDLHFKLLQLDVCKIWAAFYPISIMFYNIKYPHNILIFNIYFHKKLHSFVVFE